MNGSAHRVPLLASALLLALSSPPAMAAVNLTRIGHLDLDPGCGSGYSDALFVHDERAYVMEYRGNDLGGSCGNYEGWLHIIDVADPTNPFNLSETRLRDSYPADMHGIYYSNGYLYVGIQQPTKGVSIYDVSDPALLVEVSFISTPQGAHTLRVADHRLYIMLNPGTATQILIYDISNPRSPSPAGTISVSSNGFCHDLSVMENVGFASCWDQGLVLLDLRDPASVRVTGSYASAVTERLHSAWPLPDLATVATCQEINDRGVRTFDIRSGTPAPLDQHNLGAGTIAHDVMVVGRYAYVTYYGSGIRILDLSDPANLVEVGSFATGAGCSGYCDAISQWVEDGTLYTVDMRTGFYVFSFDLPHEAPITLLAVKAPNLTDVHFVWNHTGESQYTLRDGLSKRVVGTRRTDIDGRLAHTEAGVVPDGQLHYYKLNGPWR